MRLRRSEVGEGGLRRVRRGRGFSYTDERGHVVSAAERARIEALAIPPAWREVWICADESGHVQATGVDEAGRTQYRYHPLWREEQDAAKWERVERFARALPELRECVQVDLSKRALSRERVLALAVRLLDRGLFRVGSEQYETCGLATMHASSITLQGQAVSFDYVGKHQVRQIETIRDAQSARVIGRLLERPGDVELLAWREGDQWRDVRSSDINAYIHETIPDASAKDFRSWHGTVLCAVHLAERVDADALAYASVERELVEHRDPVAAAVEHVAAQLGNTPAVARSSYVDPRVIDAFGDGRTVDAAADAIKRAATDVEAQTAVEAATLRLLAGGGRRAIERAAALALK